MELIKRQIAKFLSEEQVARIRAFFAKHLPAKNNKIPVAFLYGFSGKQRKNISIVLNKSYKIKFLDLKKFNEDRVRYKNVSFFISSTCPKEDAQKIIGYTKEQQIPIKVVTNGFIHSAEFNQDDSIDSLTMHHVYPQEKGQPHLTAKEIDKVIGLYPARSSLQSGKDKQVIMVIGESYLDRWIHSKDSKESFSFSNWELVKEAKRENPDADIYYLPYPLQSFHEPDEYFRISEEVALKEESTLSIKHVNGFVDKVYTFSSPQALKAIQLGIPVIFKGNPLNTIHEVKKDLQRAYQIFLSRTYFIYEGKSELGLREVIPLLEKRNRQDVFVESYKQQTIQSQLPNNFQKKKVGVFSYGIAQIKQLNNLLPLDVIVNPANKQIKDLDYIGVWGLKENDRAREVIETNRIPELRMEDGFLRSFGLGVDGVPPLSLCYDDIGIYYNATKPSRLEVILNSPGWETPELLRQASKAIQLIKENQLSKYNTGELFSPQLIKETTSKKILIVDQTLGDLSISMGLASQETFMEMYQSARKSYPEGDFYIKVHPDVISGKKKGNLDLTQIKGDPNLIFLTKDSNSLSLLNYMDVVYVVTSQMGFEALMLGKEVHCFGMPFYAGWGLTNDRIRTKRRNMKRSFEEVFAAAYLLYCSYINPKTNKPGDIFDVIAEIIDQKNNIKRVKRNG
ncbi:hypothetical protein AJ85_02200 [Alkalihalobacillus alcalophilus ATCC 27647 = CGMCC 1.3604]|uniref:Capsular polysaccharide biosynthesis protein n=1 Tax=Alkalihalobacillus alcalophilus ATCC 27647 = CGMCC 1.3604 TaxID=1218173 RepID=A0A4S4JU21_ALKAL|nr:capsule polysaccharide biosynthesis [Alkalihalobacillus alcalophilus]MED1562632.1 hypothetical protein [Alkalihalobacillus alcalophilus]THG88608.1 hypothetical protein AJ85_02200 [Alkalihalobacillus alcalophilus ATCC 27647 = CGMCC 1.3604]